MDVHDYLKLHFNLPFFKTASLLAMEDYKQWLFKGFVYEFLSAGIFGPTLG